GKDRAARGLPRLRSRRGDFRSDFRRAQQRDFSVQSAARSAHAASLRWLDAGQDRPAAQRRARALVHPARTLERRILVGSDITRRRPCGGGALVRGGLKMAKAEPTAATEDLAQIRDSVRALCGKFPGEYWRALDRERAYPTEFVTALTKAGFLAALI